MNAEETTLPRPPHQASRGAVLAPHDNDKDLIRRLEDGLVASEAKEETATTYLLALTAFSAWLEQVGKRAIQGRLFTNDLTNDVEKFVRVGGNRAAPAALFHLRNIESSTHGTTQIATLEVRRDREVPAEDRQLIDLAFGGRAPVSRAIPVTKISTEASYRRAMLSFSEWLASMEQPGLADSPALHSPLMTNFAGLYVSMGLPYGHNVIAALAQLRHFDLTGTTNIKRNRTTLIIPAVDQQLIERFLAWGNARLEEAAQNTGKSVRRDKSGGRTKYDQYASCARSFSAWLHGRGLGSIASRLNDLGSLLDDLDVFGEDFKNRNSLSVQRSALRQMSAMVSEAPEVKIARITHNRFVDALRMFSANARVADVARATGASEDDLRVFLDEQSDTGLTEAGQAVVNGLDGRLRRAADANIALRVQSRRQAAQHTGQVPVQTPSPFHLSPMSPSEFPYFSGLDDPSGYGQHSGRSGSAQPGTDSIYGGLGSLGSTARFDFDLNTPAEEAAQEDRADSVFGGLSSLASDAHYGRHGVSYPSTPSEVAGPSQPRQPGQPLPLDPTGGSLHNVLAQLNLERGFASGDALNCLIDTALQFTYNMRRPDNGQTPMPELDQAVPLWRQSLATAGIVPQHGMIDFYSATRAGYNLALHLGVRIQIIQWNIDGTSAHPVLGEHGPLVHILHTPGHFQPLWPRNGGA